MTGLHAPHMSRQNLVTVDDTSPDIQYVGDWTLENWGPAFNQYVVFCRIDYVDSEPPQNHAQGKHAQRWLDLQVHRSVSRIVVAERDTHSTLHSLCD
jgi:hypothetical protein